MGNRKSQPIEQQEAYQKYWSKIQQVGLKNLQQQEQIKKEQLDMMKVETKEKLIQITQQDQQIQTFDKGQHTKQQLSFSHQQVNLKIQVSLKKPKLIDVTTQVDLSQKEEINQECKAVLMSNVSSINNKCLIQNNQQKIQLQQVQQDSQQKDQHIGLQQGQNIIEFDIDQQVQQNTQLSDEQQILQEVQQQSSQNMQQEIEQQITQNNSNEFDTNVNEEAILKRCFMINTKELKINNLYAKFLEQFQTVTSDIILSEIIYGVISSEQYIQSQKVTWLVKIVINLSECQVFEDNVIFNEGSISKLVWTKLINAVLEKLVCAVAKPEKLEWLGSREDVNNYTNLENTNASQVYDMLFGQQISKNFESSFENLDHPAINQLLTYLDTKSQQKDAQRFLDLITKRELSKCQQVNLSDCVNQQRALRLLDKLSFYPRITELLLEDSWAYGKFQQYKNGRDLQKYSMFGSILCLSTFPRDFPEVNQIFCSDQGLPILIECYRRPIYEIINQMADIFLRIIRRGKKQQLELFTYLVKLIEINLDIEKVTEKEKFDSCCYQGMMFNLQQVLLEIFNPFIYNTNQANAKISKINKDLLAQIKNQPLLAKIYSNVKQMAPLKTELIQLDKTPEIDPMTFLYLLIQKINSLQQHMIIDYVISYVILQYDKRYFGSSSKLTQQSEIDKAKYDVLLLNPRSVQNTIQFLSFQSKVASSLLDENYKPKYPYGLLSNQFMNDIFHYCFIYNSNNMALDYLDEIISICEFTIITMKYQELIEDTHLRVLGMDLFYIFNDYVIQQQHGKTSDKAFKIFSENKVIKEFLIEGLIKAYVDQDRVKVTNIIPAFRFKQAVSQLFSYILTTHSNIYNKKFVDYVQSNSDTYSNFALVYINDIKELLDQCLTTTQKLKQEEDSAQTVHIRNLTLQERKEKFLKQLLLEIAEKKCLGGWKGFEELFKNIVLFTKIEPKAFLIEVSRQTFTENLNYVVVKLNGPENNNCLTSKFFTKYDVKIEPRHLSSYIVDIFINIKNQQEFLDELAMNNSTFQLEILHQLVNQMGYLKLKTQYQLQEFLQIINSLQQLKIDYDQLFRELQQDPNRQRRYIDSLTQNLMTDPVMLPNSKQIVDRVTIKRLLLQKKEDPFDRSFLSVEMLIEQKELKQEIKSFITVKIQELRSIRPGSKQYLK
ncbi:unnamed protein product [Paramecium octaurelia]|uniref:RING-type E3 ubiquitin transferase n=1 Tax=Paramecium octaurelia TaxID=43137 RepID=A0A8S1W8R4_PAROT|nr:unnamed protein product [Paramecium octaurelia]